MILDAFGIEIRPPLTQYQMDLHALVSREAMRTFANYFKMPSTIYDERGNAVATRDLIGSTLSIRIPGKFSTE